MSQTIQQIPSTLYIVAAVSCLLLSCAERGRDNPFDPQGELKIFLSVVSEDRTVTISWNIPGLDDLSGFNLYRKQEGTDSGFVLLADDIPASQSRFTDTNIVYEETYAYYLTVIGTGVESNPSPVVRITPGPGFVWIVDKWGYQIVKTTYDLTQTLYRYYTNWPPEDMDIDPQNMTGGIVYPSAGYIEFIDLDNRTLLFDATDIRYPYRIACDRNSGSYWVIDSSGFLYEVDPIDGVIFLRSSYPEKPVHISLDPSNINVVDTRRGQVIRFSPTGAINETISEVEGRPLLSPRQFLFDDLSQRIWITEEIGSMDFLLTKDAGQEYVRVDSSARIADLALSGFGGIWYINYVGRNSSVVQLSASGQRQIKLTGFWSPYDIFVNPYDRSLLVTVSGAGRVEHYGSRNQFIGISDILNFPVKVTIQ